MGQKLEPDENVSVVGAISLKKGVLSQWSMLGYMDAHLDAAFYSGEIVA
jgi:hypothetical protein